MPDRSEERLLPERKRAREALRSAGFSSRQADALLRGGWKAVVGETQAETDELRAKVADLQSLLKLPGDRVA